MDYGTVMLLEDAPNIKVSEVKSVAVHSVLCSRQYPVLCS